MTAADLAFPESGFAVPDRVRAAALGASRLPCYVYDLPGLAEHARAVREALRFVEVFYAAKANPDARILRTLAPFVDGFEVSSGGELTHVRRTLPDARLAFGGPGKTDEELALALEKRVERIHVESPHELGRLAAFGTDVDILLRANLDIPVAGAALSMSGPFGMDEATIDALPAFERIRMRGFHTHLASGLGPEAMAALAGRVLDWALPRLGTPELPRPGSSEVPPPDAPEVNLGGGMAVDYADPGRRFDWRRYAELLGPPPPGVKLRIEPGRALTAYCGWYVTNVLDIKTTRSERYAILRGGTHHLRTPVAKGHDQPFAVLSESPGTRERVTLVGQLCTPKDVLARDVEVRRLRIGDRVAFAMAGAYAWNISHHDFLMHPKPEFHYIGD